MTTTFNPSAGGSSGVTSLNGQTGALTAVVSINGNNNAAQTIQAATSTITFDPGILVSSTGGTISIQTRGGYVYLNPVTTDTTAIIRTILPVDTTSAPVTVTMPDGAALYPGDSFFIEDVSGTAAINQITIALGANDLVNNIATNVPINFNNMHAKFVFQGLRGGQYHWLMDLSSTVSENINTVVNNMSPMIHITDDRVTIVAEINPSSYDTANSFLVYQRVGKSYLVYIYIHYLSPGVAVSRCIINVADLIPNDLGFGSLVYDNPSLTRFTGSSVFANTVTLSKMVGGSDFSEAIGQNTIEIFTSIPGDYNRFCATLFYAGDAL